MNIFCLRFRMKTKRLLNEQGPQSYIKNFVFSNVRIGSLESS